MYKRRQNFDDVAWDRSDASEEESEKRLRKESACSQVEATVTEKCGKRVEILSIITGGFNIHYRMRFDEEDSSSDVMVRVPWPAAGQLPPSEKMLYEAAVTEYVRMTLVSLLPE